MKTYIISLLAIAILAVSCNDDNNSLPTENQHYRHTAILYFSAQNSLGADGASTLDSMEIMAGAKMLRSADDNIILYLDDAKAPRIYRIYKNEKGSCKIDKVKTYGAELNSSDSTTLKDVLDFVGTKYPSDSYGLVLWSHGMGWLPDITSFSSNEKRKFKQYSPKGFGVDVGTGGNMENDIDANGQIGMQMEISALAWAVENSKIHPTYIFFDACLMQCVEVAYELRHSTDYIIGSPATTSAYGIYYTDMIPNGLFACPFTEDSIKKIVDTYYYDVMDNPHTSYGEQGCVLSVVKTSELENLASATAAYLNTAISNGEYPDMDGVQTYTSFVNTSYPDFYDISSAMKKLLTEENYIQWKKALDKCVIYTKASDKFYYYSKGYYTYYNDVDHNSVCCMSMFFPREIYTQYTYYGNLNQMFKNTKWYEVAGWKACGW